MKNLILIRHAKSNWDEPLIDINRSLSQRGINDANLVANKAKKYFPKSFLVCSSIAKRASQTAIIFAQNIPYQIENIIFEKDLYTFDMKILEQFVKNSNNDYENLILFGHNEAITNFVNKFGDVFIGNVSTSGLVFLQFNTVDWQNIENGKTLKVLFPKDLK